MMSGAKSVIVRSAQISSGDITAGWMGIVVFSPGDGEHLQGDRGPGEAAVSQCLRVLLQETPIHLVKAADLAPGQPAGEEPPGPERALQAPR
jgi:hypothetical protein